MRSWICGKAGGRATVRRAHAGPGGGHYENMIRSSLRRVGVGLVMTTGGKLYFTNDFSN